MYESVASFIIKNWCKAELLPFSTFATDFIVVTSEGSTVNIVSVELMLALFDCNRAELTDESGWSVDLNICDPFPTEMLPNPTIFVLTVTLLVSVLVKSILITPDLIFELNVPINLSEMLSLSSLSK